MPSPPPLDLTLVLAATRDMGIGRNGALPWTGLKKEMAYFARITKRLPPGIQNRQGVQNAVIMGRRTWESIPPRFRPLAGRLNVVVSRGQTPQAILAGGKDEDKEKGKEVSVVVAKSLEEAVEYLGRLRDGDAGGEGKKLGRVFVIGGAQIYKAALGMNAEARRILLTRVRSGFECDTFFPLRLDEEDGDRGWRRVEQEKMDAWVGEEVPRGVQAEAGTEYEFEMWERVD
ncbi:Dihydrofolate reductase [Madurella mycetomatis]|uniref:Dihydrofolate reductase n=1 Tax=Madurella mycetomatis TaxID=100816 RepID=A0A175W0G0_9PEZI|nr:Dihydrofolate reductase [Madurella mycetomatis]